MSSTEKTNLSFELTTSQGLTTSFETIFDKYQSEKEEIIRIANYVADNNVTNYFINGNGGSAINYAARELFKVEGAINALNSSYWSQVINLSGILDYMTAEKRNEWCGQIREMKTPDFNRDLVMDTVSNLLLSRESFIADKADGIFKNLSSKHVTNSPLAFRERLIMSHLITSYGSIDSSRSEYLTELRSIIAQVYNRDNSRVRMYDDLYGIFKEGSFGKWHEFDGGSFKIRLYKVGTVHIEIHPEVANKLNKLLAHKYPNAIASSDPAKEVKKLKIAPLRNIEVGSECMKAIRHLIERWSNLKSSFYLSSSVFDSDCSSKEMHSIIERMGGKIEDSVVSFDYDPREALKQIARTGCIPDQKSYQFYPTKEELASDMTYLLDLGKYKSEILEPSAGHGALALEVKDVWKNSSVTCVELDTLNFEILKSKGLNAVNCDFLEFKSTKKFDAVIMNPPFNQGQAEAHVKKAYKHLGDSGVLVACLPASMRGKELIPGAKHSWSVAYEDQFDNTSVRVAIVKIEK